MAKGASTRKRPSKRLRESDGAVTTVPHNSQPVQPVNVNTTGLPSLPVEIIHTILSHIPDVPFPCSDEDVSAPETFARTAAAVALSLTCRWLRATVAPLVWHTLEVCRDTCEFPDNVRDLTAEQRRKMTPNGFKSRALAVQLVNKLEAVTIREPSYALSVHTVIVKLTGYMAKNVYVEFFRALSCFKNLQVLHIMSIPYDCAQTLQKAVSRPIKRRIPTFSTQLHSVSITRSASSLLPALCASGSLKHLVFLSDGSTWFGTELQHLQQIPCENLETIELYDPVIARNFVGGSPLIEALIPILPKVKVFPIRFFIPYHVSATTMDLEHFTPLLLRHSKRLTTIQLMRKLDGVGYTIGPFTAGDVSTQPRYTTSFTTTETSNEFKTAANLLQKMRKNYDHDVKLEVWIWEYKSWYEDWTSRWTTKGVPAEIIEILG